MDTPAHHAAVLSDTLDNGVFKNELHEEKVYTRPGVQNRKWSKNKVQDKFFMITAVNLRKLVWNKNCHEHNSSPDIRAGLVWRK